MHFDTTSTKSFQVSIEESAKLKSVWKLEVDVWGGGTLPAQEKMVKKSKQQNTKETQTNAYSQGNQASVAW